MTGNPGMATMGTGDVLAGMVGALLAQGVEPFEATALGAYLHGSAGDLAAEALTTVAMTAEDLVEHVPEALWTLMDDYPDTW
jgi:NAD(P)H-hydrate epimerase